MAKRVRENITGRLISEIRYRPSTETKKSYCKFKVDTGQNIIEVTCFSDTADKVSTSNLILGTRVLCDGYQPEGEKFSLIAELVTTPEGQIEGSAIKRAIIKEHGSYAAYLQHERKYHALQAERGLVQVKFDTNKPDGINTSWEKKDDCILIGKTWRRKIDHLMDVLGPTLVNQEMKEQGFDFKASLAKDESIRYRKWRDLRIDSLEPSF